MQNPPNIDFNPPISGADGADDLWKVREPPSEGVRKMKMEKKEEQVKEGVVSGGQTQAEIDREMEKLSEEFKDLFEGVGEAKMDPIHIQVKEGTVPIAQKRRKVAYQYMDLLKKHLDELLEAGIIEGPLESADAADWVSNIVITAKSYEVEAGLEKTRVFF